MSNIAFYPDSSMSKMAGNVTRKEPVVTVKDILKPKGNPTDIIEAFRLKKPTKYSLSPTEFKNIEIATKHGLLQDMKSLLGSLSSRISSIISNRLEATKLEPLTSPIQSKTEIIPGTKTIAQSASSLNLSNSTSLNPNDLIKNLNLNTAITSGTFTINGVGMGINKNSDTLNAVINRINSSGAGVTASLSGGRFRLEGATLNLGSVADTSNFLDAMLVKTAPQTPATYAQKIGSNSIALFSGGDTPAMVTGGNAISLSSFIDTYATVTGANAIGLSAFTDTTVTVTGANAIGLSAFTDTTATVTGTNAIALSALTDTYANVTASSSIALSTDPGVTAILNGADIADPGKSVAKDYGRITINGVAVIIDDFTATNNTATLRSQAAANNVVTKITAAAIPGVTASAELNGTLYRVKLNGGQNNLTINNITYASATADWSAGFTIGQNAIGRAPSTDFGSMTLNSVNINFGVITNSSYTNATAATYVKNLINAKTADTKVTASIDATNRIVLTHQNVGTTGTINISAIGNENDSPAYTPNNNDIGLSIGTWTGTDALTDFGSMTLNGTNINLGTIINRNYTNITAAQYIRDLINDQTATTNVTANINGSNKIVLTQNQAGSYNIAITAINADSNAKPADNMGVGFSVGTTSGTDAYTDFGSMTLNGAVFNFSAILNRNYTNTTAAQYIRDTINAQTVTTNVTASINASNKIVLTQNQAGSYNIAITAISPESNANPVDNMGVGFTVGTTTGTDAKTDFGSMTLNTATFNFGAILNRNYSNTTAAQYIRDTINVQTATTNVTASIDAGNKIVLTHNFPGSNQINITAINPDSNANPADNMSVGVVVGTTSGTDALTDFGTITLNGTNINFGTMLNRNYTNTTAAQYIKNTINTQSALTNVTASINASNKIVLTQNTAGPAYSINISAVTSDSNAKPADDIATGFMAGTLVSGDVAKTDFGNMVINGVNINFGTIANASYTNTTAAQYIRDTINAQTATTNVQASIDAGNKIVLKQMSPGVINKINITTVNSDSDTRANDIPVGFTIGTTSGTNATTQSPSDLGVSDFTRTLNALGAKLTPALVSNPNGKFSINGIIINYNSDAGGDKIYDVVNKINNAPATGVNASVNEATAKLILTNKDIGPKKIELKDIIGNFLEAFQVQETVSSVKLESSSSIALISSPQPIDPNQLIKNLNIKTPITTGNFFINGVGVAVNKDSDTFNDVLARINATVPGVTASLVGDQTVLKSNNSINFIGGDTSNFLTSVFLSGATQLITTTPTTVASITAGNDIRRSALSDTMASLTGSNAIALVPTTDTKAVVTGSIVIALTGATNTAAVVTGANAIALTGATDTAAVVTGSNAIALTGAVDTAAVVTAGNPIALSSDPGVTSIVNGANVSIAKNVTRDFGRITINGQQVILDAYTSLNNTSATVRSQDAANWIVGKINTAAVPGVTATSVYDSVALLYYVQLNGGQNNLTINSVTYVNAATDLSAGFTAGQNATGRAPSTDFGKITLNGAVINFGVQPNSTLITDAGAASFVRDTINAQTGTTKVVASIDGSNRIVLTHQLTGSANSINISSVTTENDAPAYTPNNMATGFSVGPPTSGTDAYTDFGSMTLNTATFNFGAKLNRNYTNTTAAQYIRDTINAQTGTTKVTASIDAGNKIVLTHNLTGSANKIDITAINPESNANPADNMATGFSVGNTSGTTAYTDFGSMTLNGANINFGALLNSAYTNTTAATYIKDTINAVNATTKVTASIDAGNKIVLTHNLAGSANKIDITAINPESNANPPDNMASGFSVGTTSGTTAYSDFGAMTLNGANINFGALLNSAYTNTTAATYIRDTINAVNATTKVTASIDAGNKIVLTHNLAGSANKIDITAVNPESNANPPDNMASGFSVGTTSGTTASTDFGSLVLNGVNVNFGAIVNASNTNTTAAQYIKDTINAQSATTKVNASIDGGNKIVLTQTLGGSPNKINITTVTPESDADNTNNSSIGFTAPTTVAGTDATTDFGLIKINNVNINPGVIINRDYTDVTAANYIANQINTQTANTKVVASVNGANKIVLTHQLPGSGNKIDIQLVNPDTDSNNINDFPIGFIAPTTVAGTDITEYSRTSTKTLGVSDLEATLNAIATKFDPDLISTPAGQFTINGKTVSYNTDVDTINDVVNRINATPAIGVIANYDSTTNKLNMLNNDETATDITYSDDVGNFLTAFKITKLGGTTAVGELQSKGLNESINIVQGTGGTLGTTLINNITLLPEITEPDTEQSQTLTNNLENGLNVRSTGKLKLTETINTPEAITKGKFSINGKQIEIDPEKDTINDILAKINDSGAGVTAYIAGTHVEIASGAPVQLGSGSDTSNFLQAVGLKNITTKEGQLATVIGFKPVSLAGGKEKTDFGTITINDAEIDIGELNNNSYTNRTAAEYIAGKINEKIDETNVRATVDRQNRLVLTQTQTGEDAVIKIDTKIGLMGIGAGTTKGTDNITRGTVNIISNDINTKITPEMKSAIEKIKEFTDIFNTVGNTMLEMTKKGELLANDPTARAIRDKIKAIPTKEVKEINDGINTLAASGIAYGKGDDAEFLTIDNNKLLNAIQNTPENVTAIFGNSLNLLKDAMSTIDTGSVNKIEMLEKGFNKMIIEQQLNKEKSLIKQMRILNQVYDQLFPQQYALNKLAEKEN